MFDKLIDLLIQSIKLFRLFVIVREFERGVVLRWGRYVRVKEPGLLWVLPFGVDAVLESPAYVQTMRIGPQSLMTKVGEDGRRRTVVVSTLITFLVEDHKKFILLIQGGETAIEDTAYGVVAEFVMKRTYEELLAEDVAKELTLRMRQGADDYGVKVKSAKIIDLTESRSLRLISHDPTKLAAAFSS